ncbi:hypothetical protein ASZ90_008421 [hydrocarbon metagenome]|uniref:Uncharacterized protein n=1 Tax=hydrocarbon metagenome TaxID=938273 RepID=A0A0W8FLQ2_9ZZZZ
MKVCPNVTDQVKTTDPGHFVIRNDKVDRRIFQNLQGIHNIRGRKDTIAFRLEITLKNVYSGGRVIHN